MSSAISPHEETVEDDRPRVPAPAAAGAAAEMRFGIHRVRLHGATIYACRHCRTPIRVVSAAYLPENCPTCGRGTWSAEGRCAATAGCAATRPPGGRPHAHCPGCGGSVWRHVTTPDPR